PLSASAVVGFSLGAPAPPALFPYPTLFRSVPSWSSWAVATPCSASSRQLSPTQASAAKRLVNAGLSGRSSGCSSTPRNCQAHCRSEEHTSELQSREKLVCRLLLGEKKRGER